MLPSRAGRTVGDPERRRLETAGEQVAAEVEPVLVALAAAELQPEQHLAPLERDAPGDQHALGRRVVGPQLQLDRVQEAVDEVVLVQAPAAPGAVARLRVLADPRHRRLRDDRPLERFLQRRLDVAYRQPTQERTDDKRLQRVRARHPLPTISLQKPSAEALRTRGRSSSSGPAVVLTVTRS